MEQRLNKLKAIPKISRFKNVAAYARVSNSKDAMLQSLSAQVSYYSNYIQNHKGWKYAGVYYDEAISGTKDERANFQRMLEDCRLGKIDMIITKSISRFSRNTASLLIAVRQLKEYGVDVYFEEQKLHSLSSDGELMLSILASYAQEEARSVSENMLWRIRSNFKNGKVFSKTILGYRIEESTLVVVEEEAKIVKQIYELYIKGYGIGKIAKTLNESGYKSRLGNNFSRSTIFLILRNRDYTGDLLLQKTYKKDFLATRSTINNGERDSYLVENAHEEIIDKDLFESVQKEIERRSSLHPNSKKREAHLFSKLITCGHCGATLGRGKTGSRYSYRCPTYRHQGKDVCPSKNVPELEIKRLTSEVLGVKAITKKQLLNEVDEIISHIDQTLEFKLNTGEIYIKEWFVPSRKDSWTPEMKAKASLLAKKNVKKGGRQNEKN